MMEILFQVMAVVVRVKSSLGLHVSGLLQSVHQDVVTV